MAVLRLTDGSDITVKLSLAETMTALEADPASGFVELPGDEGPLHVRPGSVMAVADDARRGTAGFRVGIGTDSR